jgi:hypothetical protein
VRRTALLLAAALVLGAPVVASSSEAACPADVLAVRGDNPSYATIAGYLATSAAAHDVPVQVLKAIAYRESEWRQFRTDGTRKPLISQADDVCGIGLMQITLGDRTDGVKLASDPAYNVDEGAKILAEKWAVGLNQTWPQPKDYPPDDRDVVENWYASICRYNGCSGGGADQAYALPVARIVRSPFQSSVPGAIARYMPPSGFTTPADADPAYVFPGGFQAQHDPDKFVFYDGESGAVTKTVDAPTHLDSTPPGAGYPAGHYGPNGPNVSCVDCAFWRPYADAGVAGWAHWTNSVTGADAARAIWAPPRTGRYDVRASIPDVADPLATVTYHAGTQSAEVNQQSAKGTYAYLGRWDLSAANPVWLGDSSTVAGVRIVADAMRFSAVTSLSLTSSARTLTYGGGTTLTMKLSQVGGAGLAGRPVRLWKRNVGTLSWSPVGTYVTGAGGTVSLTAKPTKNAYYKATYGGDVDATPAGDAVVRVDVRPAVKAALSKTSVPRNTGVRVSVTVSPSHAGQQVVLQRYVSGAWRDALSATLSSSSTASWVFAKSVAGTYKYRVVKPADSDHVTGTSATLTLRVT